VTTLTLIPPGRIIAFIDIGTNSIRMLLVRLNPNQTHTILSEQKEIIRLGEGEFVDQILRPEAMQRAVLVCQKFAAMANSYGAEEIIAAATSATREAKNQEEFLRLLHRDARLDVHVISGREEARLIYLGISSGVHLGDQQAVFIDIGGGSTEVVVGGQNQYHVLDSLKLGAIRLTSLFFLPDESEPVSADRYALIKQYVRNAIIRTVQRVREYRFDLAYGSSGTIENLADIAIATAYKRRRDRDDRLTYPQLLETVGHLCSLPLEERRRIPGMNPSRADIIVAGAAILDTLMETLELGEIRISDRGLRDGLLVDYLSRGKPAAVLQEMSVRERSVLHLARSCNFDEAHSRHVARLALELFDSARELGLHDYAGGERELLDYACLLHDIGKFLSYNNHEAHTAYMIRNADLLGFDLNEIALLANVGFFHRKALPDRKKYPGYGALDKSSRRKVRALSMMLRLAESLDRGHASAVEHACLLPNNRKSAILEIQTEGDPQLEIWGSQHQIKNFEKVFGMKLRLQVKPPGIEPEKRSA
jgi:exopolyphosphatase/guanosine-5'-triphosphate,3'-diphosphate pyrophosphatase